MTELAEDWTVTYQISWELQSVLHLGVNKVVSECGAYPTIPNILIGRDVASIIATCETGGDLRETWVSSAEPSNLPRIWM